MPAQLWALWDYPGNGGYSVTLESQDEAESGRIAETPRFRQMIDEGSTAAAPFQLILVWRSSRFTRKRVHTVAFESMLRRPGIRLVAITEHADDSPTGALILATIESVEEFHPKNLAHEAVRGCGSGVQASICYKRIKVSGWVKERPTLEVEPMAAAIVKGGIRNFPLAQRAE